MDNLNYVPKKLNMNKNKNINIIELPNKDLDINNQDLFPNLDIKNKSNQSPIQNQTINWKDISKDFENKPLIKELNKNEQKESTIQTVKLNIIEDTNNIKLEKQKSSYIDDSGWTHIVKSKKSNYKEKKKKDTTDIDERIKTVIST